MCAGVPDCLPSPSPLPSATLGLTSSSTGSPHPHLASLITSPCLFPGGWELTERPFGFKTFTAGSCLKGFRIYREV